MLTLYAAGSNPVEVTDLTVLPELLPNAFWIDAFDPQDEEEQALERGLGFGVPTRLEMQEIEASSRLYMEENALVMTATVLCNADTPNPESSPLTFILTPDKLVTLRYADPVAFRTFRNQVTQGKERTRSSDKALAVLIDSFIDRLADILENVGAQIDALSRAVFRTPASNGTTGGTSGNSTGQDYQAVLKKLGHISDLLGRARESLVSFGRLNSFWADAQNAANGPIEGLHHANAVSRDIVSLTDHASFLSGKVSFLLDATLGLINVEQNAIIKVFSILAVVFLPPTLIGTIYGMNFEHMPELKWTYGYPLAVTAMVFSAVLPYFYFKRKGWY